MRLAAVTMIAALAGCAPMPAPEPVFVPTPESELTTPNVICLVADLHDWSRPRPPAPDFGGSYACRESIRHEWYWIGRYGSCLYVPAFHRKP